MLVPRLSPDREEPQQGLPKPAQPFIPRQSGVNQPPLPSQPAVILASAVPGKEAGGSGKRTAGASPPAGRAKASSAQPRRERDPRRQEKHKTKENVSMVTARPPGPVRWAGKGRRSCPVGWLQLLFPGASRPRLGQEPWAPVRLMPGRRVQTGAIREGAGGQGVGSEPLGVGSREQLPLMVQEELGKGVDGINGLESDGSILGP